MSVKPTYETQRIDHLGIVSGICQQLSLTEKIDALVKTSERKVSCGKGTQAIILNALGFVGRALHLMPEYLHNKPVDLLIDPELTAFSRDPTMRYFLRSLIKPPGSVVYYLIALLLPPFMDWVGSWISGISGQAAYYAPPRMTGWHAFQVVSITFFYQSFYGNILGEEVSWRGFALPR